MSYCRFSSDNWKSDVYVYEAEAGFTVHVALSRFVGDIPPLLPWSEKNHDAWVKSYEEQMEVVSRLPTQHIGGPFDGKTFIYRNLAELRIGLRGLQAAGYHIPEFVFEMIDEDEEDDKPVAD